MTSLPTKPEEAAKLVEEAQPDALAISVGNVHLQTSAKSGINREVLTEIERVTDIPLVIHGASGIRSEDRRWLATKTKVCKFNVGTELRQAFGSVLREVLAQDDYIFDRNQIMSQVKSAMIEQTKLVLKSFEN